jgi:hypothetical protein
MVKVKRAAVADGCQSLLRFSLRDGLMLILGVCFAKLLFRETTFTYEDTPSSSLLRSSSEVATSSSKGSGWNPIHVYYGKMDHLTNSIPPRWWIKWSPKHNGDEWTGQHGQDVAVAKSFDFKQNGFFVDLASNDAVWASNTFMLEQNLDWKGICIEANPIYWYRLSFRNCHAVGAIVGGDTNIEVNVTLASDRIAAPYGGIVGNEMDNKGTSKKALTNAEPRYTASLKSILKKFNAPSTIDYLSLDVEGAELFIMKDFPFDEYKFKVLTIERPKDQLLALLESNGYKKLLNFKRGDTMWAHKSFYDTAKALLEKHPEEIDAHKVQYFPPGFKK